MSHNSGKDMPDNSRASKDPEPAIFTQPTAQSSSSRWKTLVQDSSKRLRKSFAKRPPPLTATSRPQPISIRPPQPNAASSAVNLPSIDRPFKVDAPVAIYEGGSSVAYDDVGQAVIIYDSGCEQDLVSTAYIASAARSKPMETTPRRTLAMSITGAPFDSLGEVDIRWLDPNFTSYRYLETRCLVVESDFFDIIIGRKTIQRLQLYVRNSVSVAGQTFRPRPLLDSKYSTTAYHLTC
jgi:hypothetical protein